MSFEFAAAKPRNCICKDCGAPFQAEVRRYLCDKCRIIKANAKLRLTHERICWHCGEGFTSRNRSTRYCPDCHQDRPCSHCGEMMYSVLPARTHCCSFCYYAAQGVMC